MGRYRSRSEAIIFGSMRINGMKQSKLEQMIGIIKAQ